MPVNNKASTLFPGHQPADTTYRNPWGANPIVLPDRAMVVDLADSSNPRFMHPKLNQTPWSTSYAQSRVPPKQTEAVFRGKRAKRSFKEKRNRRKK